MTLKLIVFSVILMALAVLLFGIGILFKKDGHFPDGHIENNEHLKKKGIGCPRKM